MKDVKPKPGSIDGDTVNCFHKRGGCNCLDKAVDLLGRQGAPVYIASQSGRMVMELKEGKFILRAEHEPWKV